MPVRIGTNLDSLRAQRRLAQTSNELSNVTQRLSSGQRINRPSDDAAGLAVVQSLQNRSRVFSQGVRNFNDGLSALNIADGALEQLSSILPRIQELATQSANGTFSSSQRASLDKEAQALSKEFDRITQSTSFNGIFLLSGSTQELRFQGGFGTDGGISSGLGGAVANGTFSGATSFTADGQIVNAAQIGDLNGDGNLDVVTAGQNATDGTFVVRLGDGSGSLGAATTYLAESLFSGDVRLADLNNDGKLDVITGGRTDANQGNVNVRLGAGDGTFGASISFVSETFETRGLEIADLNGDGKLDLITTGRDASDGYTTVRLGDGTGTFGTATSYAAESNQSIDVKLRDINRDGILDLISAGRSDASTGFATVRLGIGNGTFGTATSYAAETSNTFSLELGDVNGDGNLDLFTGGMTGAFVGAATVRLGTGAGTFGTATSYLMDTGASWTVTLQDLNNDGFQDLVTGGISGSDGTVYFRLNDGTGTFGAATSIAAESAHTRAVLFKDLNNDGVADLVSGGFSDGNVGYSTVRIAQVNSGVSSILPFSLATLSDARQALAPLQRKLDQLSEQRGKIGAFQSRLNSAISTLGSSVENYASATSRIADSDIAIESANYTRLQILQNATVAILAQANQGPKIALTLLGPK